MRNSIKAKSLFAQGSRAVVEFLRCCVLLHLLGGGGGDFSLDG